MNVYLIECLFGNIKSYPFSIFYSDSDENAKKETLHRILNELGSIKKELNINNVNLLKLKIEHSTDVPSKFILDRVVCRWIINEESLIETTSENINKRIIYIDSAEKFENIFGKKAFILNSEVTTDNMSGDRIYQVIATGWFGNEKLVKQFSCHCDIKAKQMFKNSLNDIIKQDVDDGILYHYYTLKLDKKVIDVYSNADKVLI